MNLFIKLCFISLFAFLFNLAWEVPHSLLYKTTTEMSVRQYVPRILNASAGDIIMIIMIFFGIALINKSLNWPLNRKNMLLSILFGIVIAVIFEIYAQYTNRFEYLPKMPILPFINVGLTPVLQMIFTPLATFWVVEKIITS